MSEQKVANEIVTGSYEEAQKWIGYETDFYEPIDLVEKGAIRFLSEVIEDPNPLYYDEQLAEQSIWKGIIAPPTSYMVWAAPPRWVPEPLRKKHPMNLVKEIPLPGSALVLTEIDQTCYLPIYPGDRIRYKQRVVDMFPKSSRMGDGHILIIDRIYENQNADCIGVIRTTGFRYTPFS